MRAWMCLCLLHLSSAAIALNAGYLPPSGPRATEYISYSAPVEDQTAPLQAARQLAAVLSPPHQVVFIRTPETNLFTLTAKQLATRNALDIYVLQRQTDTQSLAEQQAAIQQKLARKPEVHFVKYRTPADVSRALSTLRSSYEQLPGSSSSYATQQADVIELDHKPQPQQLQPQRQEPVIFKIRPHGGQHYETHEQANDVEAARLGALFRQYLPRS